MAGSFEEIIRAIPNQPGTYTLCLSVDRIQRVQIGQLGEFTFPPGNYFYSGSAWGPGGLRARLKHHLCQTVKPHWHIDTLRNIAQIKTIWYTTSPQRLECVWNRVVASLPGACIVARGVGASDCHNRCPAHLVAFSSLSSLAGIDDCLSLASGDWVVSKMNKIE